MSDPAMAAAMRAMKQRADNRIAQGAIAAREALAPIRELHKPHRELEWDGEWSDPHCRTCAHEQWGDLSHQPWPCDTAKLAYSSEELTND